MANNCLYSELNVAVNNNNILKRGEMRMQIKKCTFIATEETEVSILTPNVTFVGGGTTATIGTTATVLETTAQAVISIANKYAIKVISAKTNTILDLNTAGLINMQTIDDDNNSSNNMVGNIENLQNSPIYQLSAVKIADGSAITGDIAKAFSRINEIERPLVVKLKGTGALGIYGNIEFLNNVGIYVYDFEVENASINGDISNLTCEFHSPSSSRKPLFYLPDCSGVSGSVEDFVATQRAAGWTTGYMKVYLRGTSCTYNGYTFTTNTAYLLEWTADSITMTPTAI